MLVSFLAFVAGFASDIDAVVVVVVAFAMLSHNPLKCFINFYRLRKLFISFRNTLLACSRLICFVRFLLLLVDTMDYGHY